MNNKKIAFGIGMVMAILTVFTASAAADNVLYLVPEDSIADPDNSTIVLLMLNTTQSDIRGVQCHIKFDYNVVNVTNAEEGTFDWDSWNWAHKEYEGEKYLFIGGMKFSGCGPGEIQVGKLTLTGVNLGITPIEFANQYNGTGTKPWEPTMITDTGNIPQDFTATDGTFTCGGVQTFTKSLPKGWNLISLPLTPVDNTTDTVLSGVTKNAVKQYNATSKQFEDTTIMDPGTGYFVHVTAASTWEYVGESVSLTSTQLKSGLNMIGVPNCGMSVGNAMGSTDYRYAARWNATSQNYEVHNPNAPTAFHGFDTMEPGEGYFVSAKLDYTPWGINCPP